MSGPTLTLAEAARRCSCSESTLRRKLKADEIEGAERLPTGAWALPIAGLVTAGLLDGVSPPESSLPEDTDEQSDTDELRQRIETLETEAADHMRRETELRHRAELAEAIAEERSQALDDARLALRMLEAGNTPQALPATTEDGSTPKTPDDPPAKEIDGPKRGAFRRWLMG